jgi:hypothetical protein
LRGTAGAPKVHCPAPSRGAGATHRASAQAFQARRWEIPPRRPHQKSRRFGPMHRSLVVTCVPALGRRPRSRSNPQQRGPRPAQMRNPCRAVDRRASSLVLWTGVAIFGRKGATRHGRHRVHSAGDRRGAYRLLRRQAVEDEGPMGHRVAEPGLSTLRHVHARDPPAHINRGSDVGRMDVPEMRLQGRQVWTRAGCTLRRHTRVPQVGRGCARSLSAAADLRLVPDASLQPATVARNSTMTHQATSASEARRRDKAQPVPPANKLPLQPTRIP